MNRCYELREARPKEERGTADLSTGNVISYAVSQKEKESYADILRRHGLEAKLYSALRWKKNQVLRGIYWWYFARYIRMRDYQKYGKCISCNRQTDFEQMQAGHFVPVATGGFSLLLDPTNVNGECEGCNGFDEMHLRGYERNLDIRYGAGTGEELVRRKHQDSMKEWSKLEYENIKIPEIRAQYEELLKTQ